MHEPTLFDAVEEPTLFDLAVAEKQDKDRLRKILASGMVAVDTETTGLDVWHGDTPFIVSFCNETGDTGYMEWPVDPWTRIVHPDEEDLDILHWFFGEPEITKVMHNGKFDVRALSESFGIELKGIPEETIFAAHGCNSHEHSLGLKYLGEKYMQISRDDERDLQSAVVRVRNRAKKLGWDIAFDEKLEPDGTLKSEAAVEADYWILKAYEKYFPGALEQLGIDHNLASIYAVKDVERTMIGIHLFRRGLEERQSEFEQAVHHITIREGEAQARKQYPVKMDAVGIYELERRLWPIFYGMETRGIRLDLPACEKECETYSQEWAKLRGSIKQVCRENGLADLNIDHPASLGKLLFGKLRIPPKSYTAPTKRHPLGQPQVNQEALEDYAESVPAVRDIMRYRASGKAFSVFREFKDASIPDRFVAGCHSLRTDYQQIGPKTGRVASRRPPLQNVADSNKSRSAEPFQARGVLGPRPGYVLLMGDYSGQEICIFADVSQEKNMCDSLRAGRDVHSDCANLIWGGENNPRAIEAMTRTLRLAAHEHVPSPELLAFWKTWGVRDVSRLKDADYGVLARQALAKHNWEIVKCELSLGKNTWRNVTKMLEFLKVYGGGYAGAAALIGGSMDEVRAIVDAFDERFPRINEYSRELIRQSSRDGFIVTKYGRRLTIPEDRPYVCVNYMVQGSAADQMKTSMDKIAPWLKTTGLDAHILLTVHDELIFEVRAGDVTARLLQGITQRMTNHNIPGCPPRFSVPIKVDFKIARERWCEAEKIKF